MSGAYFVPLPPHGLAVPSHAAYLLSVDDLMPQVAVAAVAAVSAMYDVIKNQATTKKLQMR